MILWNICVQLCRKIANFVATRCRILRLKCTKFDFSCGSNPDSTGALTASPLTSQWTLLTCQMLAYLISRCFDKRSSSIAALCFLLVSDGSTNSDFSRSTAAAAPLPFRPGNPALCGSCPLVTPYYCRLWDLLCFVFMSAYCMYVWFICVLFVPSVFWYSWLGLLACKNRLPYNLYCDAGDVKHCSIQSVREPSLYLGLRFGTQPAPLRLFDTTLQMFRHKLKTNLFQE